MLEQPRDHFTYRVSWSDEDGEYVGLCAEFPSLSHLDSSQEAALRGIRSLVDDVVADMREKGEPIPGAIADQPFSGKVLVRLPPQQHRALAIEAAEVGVSLNRLVSYRLSVPPAVPSFAKATNAPAASRASSPGAVTKRKRAPGR
jgi:predicted HicB family RNase H-like nuclease